MPKQLNERFGNAVSPFSQLAAAAKGKGKGSKGGEAREGKSHSDRSHHGKAESKPDATYKRQSPAEAIRQRMEREQREQRE